MITEILLSAGLAGSVVQAPGYDSAYTSLEQCEEIAPLAGAPFAMQCDGRDGIGVVVGYSDAVQRAAFGDLGHEAQFSESPLNTGAFQALAETLEWRLKDGEAFATILRWTAYRPAFDPDTGEETGVFDTVEHYLTVSALRPGGQNGVSACHVAYVDLSTTWRANDVARRIAERDAPGFVCGEDAPRFVDPDESIAVLEDAPG
ncbi:MAG: hypothetical protein ABL308_08460 [Oceanicaulis sp.]